MFHSSSRRGKMPQDKCKPKQAVYVKIVQTCMAVLRRIDFSLTFPEVNLGYRTACYLQNQPAPSRLGVAWGLLLFQIDCSSCVSFPSYLLGVYAVHWLPLTFPCKIRSLFLEKGSNLLGIGIGRESPRLSGFSCAWTLLTPWLVMGT